MSMVLNCWAVRSPRAYQSAAAATLSDAGDLINTDKALSVIIAIFVSRVGVAFFFGMLVQWLARIVFTFNYTREDGNYSIGIFSGIAATSIVCFMLIKTKDGSFMTPENKHWIQDNTAMLIGCFFVFFTILMQVLHWCKVNVFKIIVLLGTFATCPRLCRQRLGELYRCASRRLLLFHRLYRQRHCCRTRRLLVKPRCSAPKRRGILFPYQRGRHHHGICAVCTSKKAHNVIKTS